MWTTENRAKYDRSGLRYPSDLTDAEWSLVGPLIPPAKRGGNKRTVDEREIVNGVMYIPSTGCQWAARGEQMIMVRCTKTNGVVQPDKPIWNPAGFMQNVIEVTPATAI